MLKEVLISMDIEASGPIPPKYSMLSLGACLIENTNEVFYIEIKPVNLCFVHEALAVAGFDLERPQETGVDPKTAMKSFADWIALKSFEKRPIFVGFNGMFDWSFVNFYFLEYLGNNPFGFSGIDMKSYGMGITGKDWSHARTDLHFNPELPTMHNALDDAVRQAIMFSKMLEKSQG